MTRDDIRNVLGFWYHKELFQPLTPKPHTSTLISPESFPWQEENPTDTAYRLQGILAVTHDLAAHAKLNDPGDFFQPDSAENTVGYTIGLDSKGHYVKGSFHLSYYFWAVAQLVSADDKPVSLNPDKCRALSQDLDQEFSLANPVFDADIILALNTSITNVLFRSVDIPADLNWYSLTPTINPIKDIQRDSKLLDELQTAAAYFSQGSAVPKYTAGLQAAEDPRLGDLGDETLWQKYLKPSDFSLAQWPDKQDLNLAEQWVVNRIVNTKDKGTMLSFQAPADSGRKQVVSDLVAHSVLERATFLANLAKPSDAFTMRRFQYPPNDNSGNFYVPTLPLANTQMILSAEDTEPLQELSAYLNDRERLTRNQTHTDAFDRTESTEIYFTQLANQLLDQEAWGLGSLVLESTEDVRRLVDHLLPQMSKKNTLSWEEAKTRFARAKAKVEQKVADLTKTYNASHEVAAIEIEKEKIEQRIDHLTGQAEALAESGQQEAQLVALAKQHHEGREQDLQTLQNDMHGFGKWLFKILRVGPYAKQQQVLAAKVTQAAEEVTRQEDRLRQTERDLKDKYLKLEMLNQQREEKQRLIDEHRPATDLMRAALGKNFADHSFYKALDSEETQQACPWMDFEFAALRERLLKAAFDLQKSFIIHANEVRQNLKRLQLVLQGDFRLDDVAYAMPSLLHTIQLIVPLTLVNRSYLSELMWHCREVENGTLVVLDPAQSEPAEWVGAIWRANKIVTFGDFLQMSRRKSPNSRLTYELSRYFGVPFPYADAANSAADFFRGAEKEVYAVSKSLVPFPLRTLATLAEPLFTLDNQMSWGGLLIGSPASETVGEDSFLEKSAWLEIDGETAPESLFVPLQADLLSDQLTSYVDEHAKLPELGVTSFFPSVYRGLVNYIETTWLKEDSAFRQSLTETQIRKWVETHVFLLSQWSGNPYPEVVFLTGGDPETEAQELDLFTFTAEPLHTLFRTVRERILLIGDSDVWAGHPPLDRIYAKLTKDEPKVIGHKKLVFLRAGRTTEDNEKLLISKADTRLSEDGVQELRALAKEERYPQTDKYYTSNLIRAKETLPVLLPAEHATLERADFNEVQIKNWEYGAYDTPEAQAFLQCWYAGDDLGEDVESYASFYARVNSAVDALLNELERVGHASATVVTHQLWLRTYFMSLLDNAEQYEPYLSFTHGGGYIVEYHRVGNSWKVSHVELLPESIEHADDK